MTLMTLNCCKFKLSRNFALLRIFGITVFLVDGVTVKNASEGWFSELCPIYQGCHTLTFALARHSCTLFGGWERRAVHAGARVARPGMFLYKFVYWMSTPQPAFWHCAIGSVYRIRNKLYRISHDLTTRVRNALVKYKSVWFRYIVCAEYWRWLYS